MLRYDGTMSQVQREIRQQQPFTSRSQEALIGVLRTADVFRWLGARLLAPHGVTLQQYNVLRILRGAEPEGLPTLEIGGRMIERAPGVTRLLDRLEAKGFVRRARCPTDRRQMLCTITERGMKLLELLDGPVQQLDTEAFAALSEAELVLLIAMLDRVRAAHGAGA